MTPAPSNTDDRITIRLSPRDLKYLHAICKAIAAHPGHACLLGLRRDTHVEAARDLLERIPNIVPSPAEASA